MLLDVGGYTESLRRSEDYSLALRILIRGYNPAWISGKHALYRVHPGQMSRQKISMIQSALTVFKQIEPESLPSDAHRAMLASRIREHEQEMRVLEGRIAPATRSGWPTASDRFAGGSGLLILVPAATRGGGRGVPDLKSV